MVYRGAGGGSGVRLGGATTGLRSAGHPRNPNHHRVILALSAAFGDTYLRDDDAVRLWLTGAGPRSVREEAEQWQFVAP